jgi:hypothetical protein
LAFLPEPIAVKLLMQSNFPVVASAYQMSTKKLGCSFLLPFLQSETPPKGILQESFSFLSEMEDSFFIFLQFGTPQKERDSFGFE